MNTDYTKKGFEWICYQLDCYEDHNDGHGRVALFEGAHENRQADVLLFDAATVPEWMRTGFWQFDVYPQYSSAGDLPCEYEAHHTEH